MRSGEAVGRGGGCGGGVGGARGRVSPAIWSRRGEGGAGFQQTAQWTPGRIRADTRLGGTAGGAARGARGGVPSALPCGVSKR